MLLLLAACGGGGGGYTPRSVLGPAPVLPELALFDGATVTCANASLGARSVGAVVVPRGQVCVLRGTRVMGDITLEPGSELDARNVSVSGSVLADRAASVVLAGDTGIRGYVRFAGVLRGAIVGVQIDGDLLLSASRGLQVVEANRVGGRLDADGNLGGLTLLHNDVVGRLRCSANQPLPVGAGNTAAGFDGQCAGFDVAGAPDLPVPVNPPVPPVWPAEVVRLPEAFLAPNANIVCENVRLGTQTYANVSIPTGAGCEMRGTRIEGSVDLASGAWLDAQGAAIAGSVRADGASAVLINESTVWGNVQAERGQSMTVAASTIYGSILSRIQRSLQWLQWLRVYGMLEVLDDTGGVSLHSTDVSGSLRCRGNLPAPTGTNNTAVTIEDQCRSL